MIIMLYQLVEDLLSIVRLMMHSVLLVYLPVHPFLATHTEADTLSVDKQDYSLLATDMVAHSVAVDSS
jgi:hypothetical protein